MFGWEKYEAIYNSIRYLNSQKRWHHIYSHYFAKIKVDFYDYLLTVKKMTLYNVIMHIKSILNKDKSHYYYKIFLEKCSYQLAKK